MAWVIGLLAAAGVVVLLVLSIPVDLAVQLETPGAEKVQIRLIWLFGMLNLSLSGPGSRSKRSPPKTGKTPLRTHAARRVWAATGSKDFVPAIGRLIRRLFAAVTIRDLRLHIRFGCDDPADTGLLLAAAAPAIGLLRAWSAEHFSAEADFQQEVLDIDGHLALRIYPVRIVGASVLFLFSPATLRTARSVYTCRGDTI